MAGLEAIETISTDHTTVLAKFSAYLTNLLDFLESFDERQLRMVRANAVGRHYDILSSLHSQPWGLSLLHLCSFLFSWSGRGGKRKGYSLCQRTC